MTEFAIRKIVTQIEEIHHEGGPLAANPPMRGAVYAICANPFAGTYVDDLVPAIEEMIAYKGPYVLDVEVPYQAHVLPMIPSGMTVKDIIKD